MKLHRMQSVHVNINENESELSIPRGTILHCYLKHLWKGERVGKKHTNMGRVGVITAWSRTSSVTHSLNYRSEHKRNASMPIIFHD